MAQPTIQKGIPIPGGYNGKYVYEPRLFYGLMEQMQVGDSVFVPAKTHADLNRRRSAMYARADKLKRVIRTEEGFFEGAEGFRFWRIA